MIRKLRKYLPHHDTFRNNRHIARFGPRLQHQQLWHWNRRSVRGGVAAGMFAGLIPGSNPVQFTAAALLSVAFRVNLPVAVGVTLYSNPFTIVPLYYCAYKLGQLVTLQGNGDIPAFDFGIEGKSLTEWLPAIWHWVTEIGKPLLIGLPVLAVLLTIAGYFLTDWAWRMLVIYEWRRRCARRKSVGH